MYWYDGKLSQQDTLQLHINEPGLLYGATVFTTMRVYQQSLSHPLTNWNAHCDRLKQSLTVFNWQQPNWQHLQQGVETLLASFPVLRITIFPNGRELIVGRNLPLDLTQRQQGITAWLAADNLFRRDIATYKTGNYLGAYLALQKANKHGAKEAILIDTNGNWLETSTGNLWGWHDGCWYTPALASGILPGIARSQLLNYLRQQNIAVRENIWTLEFVRGLQALAYSNCVAEVVPILSVTGECNRTFAKNQIYEQLRSYFLSLTKPD
ncbi:aminotransferase class IV [Myxosarcina sp. GI1]|uniref:aminotransferase class IV n=1 Tax=Myxosarcina sp. GI1 TaxID=1541065 RepID=UPI000565170C|nr:aminotransferase class IV [Myxosarcina sp. GI1]